MDRSLVVVGLSNRKSGVAVDCVDRRIDTGIEQKLHHLGAAAGGCFVQRRAAALAQCFRIGAAVD